jgi:glycine/D-amino acid oxidase-like deaminating enzyme
MSEQFKEIVVLESYDPNRLGPDTLRNSGILQSGLLYAEKIPKLVEIMWAARERLFRLAGLIQPSSPAGVLRTRQPANVEKLVADLNLEEQGLTVQRLASGRAKRLVGPFFDDSDTYYSIPDTTFEVDELLEALIGRAERLPGVHLRESDVKLVADSKAPCGVVVETDFEAIAPHRLAVCAGAGTGPLLSQIGLQLPERTFQQAPLLVFECLTRPPMEASVLGELFLERGQHVVVAQHRRSDSSHFVIGNETCSTNMVREVSSQQKRDLLASIPPGLLNGAKPRYTSAFHHRRIRHEVLNFQQFPRVIAGSPGRATMAAFAAEDLERMIHRMPIAWDQLDRADAPGGKRLHYRRRMHYTNSSFDEGEAE